VIRRSFRARAAAVAALAVAAAWGAVGCGDDERAALTDTQRTSSPPLTQEPAQTVISTGTGEITASLPGTPRSPPPAETGTVRERSGGAVAPEEQEGGAGDEAGARSPVELRVDGEGVTPRQSRIPPFLGIALTLRSSDGAAHRVRIATVPDQLAVPASGSVTRAVAGLQPGTYAILVDGRSTDAVIRAGDGG